ncbi:hypothetical protein, partial [Desulfogranum marinum]|uniref:hypothetical protein n=1 Tax=Desulfogranum marinum TaxID=453220 RepID=UPI001963014F
PKTMAGIEWNPWPESIGMGGRNEMESPAGIPWNQWPDCSGILNFISLVQLEPLYSLFSQTAQKR